MSKKKNIQIRCSCGAEFELPKGLKGEFVCECGERYGVNAEEKIQVIPSPYPVYPQRPYRPYWRYDGPWYGGGTRITSGSPNISSGGAALEATYPGSNVIAVATTTATGLSTEIL